jgi:hypothetical protein
MVVDAEIRFQTIFLRIGKIRAGLLRILKAGFTNYVGFAIPNEIFSRLFLYTKTLRLKLFRRKTLTSNGVLGEFKKLKWCGVEYIFMRFLSSP